MKAPDDLTFNMIGATMAYYDLTFNVTGATLESTSQNPLLAYINQEFVAIKQNCLDGTPVSSDREVPLPLSFCRSAPSKRQVSFR